MSSSRARRGALVVSLASVAALIGAANAAEDLSHLQVTPQRGQSADQARRDRYECHNWAVEQTGETPIAASAREPEEQAREEQKHAERVGRVVNGAAIGAGLGGLVRATQNENPANGILAGAAVGAAIGAASGRAKERKEAKAEAEAVPVPSDYLRALTACMQGRGYTVALPAPAEAVASR
jgi:hypothetical protein